MKDKTLIPGIFISLAMILTVISIFVFKLVILILAFDCTLYALLKINENYNKE